MNVHGQNALRSISMIFLFLLFANSISAANTGKISGRVTEAETGLPMPGVTIRIDGTSRGTISDLDGNYTLLNLTPGSYTIIFSSVGYSNLRVEGVQVFTDQTRPLDAEMRLENTTLGELVVQATRPVVERDRTTTVSFIDSETLRDLPATEIRDVIRLQAGVVQGSDGSLHFRGGRSREVAYLVDGVPVTNNFSQGGGSSTAIENNYVNEIQVITGTFDAQYGAAQSGVVSITTLDPSLMHNGSLAFYSGSYISSLDQRYIGINEFRPSAERDVQWTLSGPVLKNGKMGYFISGRFNDNDGYLRGERRFNIEDGFAIDAYKRWFRDFGAGNLEDNRGIPIPDSLATGDGAIVDMGVSQKFNASLKLLYRLSNSARLTYTYFHEDGKSQGYRDSWKYAPDGRSTGYSKSSQHILNLRQTLASNLFLNVRGSYQTRNGKSYLYNDPFDSRYVSVGGSDDITGYSFGNNDLGRSFSKSYTMILNSDITWQIDQINEFKAGVEYRQFTYKGLSEGLRWVEQTRNYPSPENGFLSFQDYLYTVSQTLPRLRLSELGDQSFDNYRQTPVEFSAFAQNKLEFGNQLVVKVGLRFDRFDPSENILIDKRASVDNIGSEINRISTKIKEQVSPRIGLSFPISSKGAFRTAYGHFFQMPSYSLMYSNPINELTNVGRLEGSTVGNPDLEPERTTKYEIGLQQQIGENIGIDITMYYSSVRNLLGLELVTTVDNISYRRYVNRDYGAIKGVTVSFELLKSGLLSGGIDYTLQYARGSASNPNDLQIIQVADRIGGGSEAFVERQILPLDWDQRHTVNMSMIASKSKNWSIGIIGNFGNGQPYTPTSISQRDFPETEFKNSARKPVQYNLDLRGQKTVSMAGLDASLFVRVFNLLDRQNENNVDSGTGRATNIGRTNFDLNERTRLLESVGLFTLDESDQRPTWFSSPRQVQVGLTVNF